MSILNAQSELKNFPSVPNLKVAYTTRKKKSANGFGSPSLRKITARPMNGDSNTFNNEMARHGFLKDLNELSSFNAFFEHPSPHNLKSVDYGY
jgi:hypothetical protein